MFDEGGFGPEEIAWIERDQYVYFVTLAHELTGTADWPALREELVAALTAAWGLTTIWGHLDRAANERRATERIRRAFVVLDQVRARHDPAEDWEAFFDALWEARGPLCEEVEV